MEHHSEGGGRATNWLDRSWRDHWIAVALTPVHPPAVAALRSDMMRLMAIDPTHPLCCTLEDGGRRWQPVAAADRRAHVESIFVPGPALSPEQTWPYLMAHRPDLASRAPFRVVVGPDSLAVYFTHTAGDASVFVPFSALIAQGDVLGLRALRSDAGTAVAVRMLLLQMRSHGVDWVRHWRMGERDVRQTSQVPTTGLLASQPTPDGAAVLLTAAESSAFSLWRKRCAPGISPAALLTSATYRALTAQGLPIRSDGFYTLVDLRRYLPVSQSRLPGNLAKSVFVPVAIADPGAVAGALRHLVDSARAVPALTSGVLAAGLGMRPQPAAAGEFRGAALTFNSIMRNPGAEFVPWTDPAEARYLMMSYPVAPQSISVAACGLDHRLLFSASFDSTVLHGAAVQRALEQLRDLPGLLSSLMTTELEIAGEAGVLDVTR